MNFALGDALAAGKLSDEGLVAIMEGAQFLRGIYCVGQTEEEIATEEETLP